MTGAPPYDPVPVIGLTSYVARARWGVWDQDAALLPWSYVRSVLRAGGVPVLLPPLPGAIEAALPRIDGLLLTGGPDVAPDRYGQDAGPDTQLPQPDRDDAETALLAEAVAAGMPVLGICRGLQLLNVARGGTLVQHLPDLLGTEGHAPEPGVMGNHPVRVAAGTRLAGALGRTAVDDVPTYHHQGIDELGRGLVASAWAQDGVVEAVEDPALPFCVAVQWHPEEGDDPALFDALVRAAADRAAARESNDQDPDAGGSARRGPRHAEPAPHGSPRHPEGGTNGAR